MMSDLPNIALSIRQPWAWLITAGHKDIENRTWATKFRGPVLIHAGKGMTRVEYDNCDWTSRDLGVCLPHFLALQRGGIVGMAEIVDCVESSDSPWFTGPYGFVIRNARPLPFQPCKGALNFFEPKGLGKANG